MTRDELIAALAAYRRPGTPTFGRHFVRLPRDVIQAENVPFLLDILWDESLPGKVRDHAAGALGETGDARAVELLIDALQVTAVRRGAATALGRLRAVEAVAALRAISEPVRAARWALSQLPQPLDVAALLGDFAAGALRYIRPQLARLSAAEAVRVRQVVCAGLRTVLDDDDLRDRYCWMVTALQYLPPDRQASDLLAAAMLRVAGMGDEPMSLRAALLKALSALRPLQAVPSLVELLRRLNHPGYRGTAARCLRQIIEAHGEAGRRAVAAHRAVVEATLVDVEQRRAQARHVDPEVSWDHSPGTPGWFAESDRACKSLTRLLTVLE